MIDDKKYKYQPTYFNQDLCNYLEISPLKRYYKNYLLKKLLNKLEFKLGHYRLDDDLYNILEQNNIFVYGWCKSSSKNSLSKYLSKLRSSTPNKNYLILSIDEKGNKIDSISI